MEHAGRYRPLKSRSASAFVVVPLACLALTLPACEESTIADLPYIERIVVQSILDPREDSLFVLFSRTLPLSETYDNSKAVLTDVDASIIAFDGNSYRLVHVGGGRYTAPGLTLVPGGWYELRASWNGKSVGGRTTIPLSPVVREATQAPSGTGTTVTSLVEARDGEVYGQTWELHTASGWSSGGSFTEIRRGEDAGSDGLLELAEAYGFTPAANETLYAVVHAFDRPFYDYFISRGGNLPGYDDLLFRPVGGYVSWNVTGDGIGLFLGRAVARRRTEGP